jgi:gamma-glutamylcyclotransferase (GGCT)/AIG2-like uncharacterized protein YtfP
MSHTTSTPAKAAKEEKAAKARPHYMAVYGTLRRNFHNHGLLKHVGFDQIGDGRTKNQHTLAVHSLPYAFKAPATSQVRVEVYAVDDNGLRALDGLEGHPRWYRREQIPVVLDNNEEVTAWLYFMNGGEPDAVSIEVTGDYEENQRRKGYF